ncbi:F-box/LRR-repeat protein At5g63520-like [Olea europaea var. sylvestris]|uniref:F-box/LRR-repeat protein At5g63520-like n=1 Tax=Olea europaea var. sylvestris TaxID=158386 RepID=UPI000C1D82C3|nr:F-box/LRR-repeat protein At5g63520-like [Olea europaea var. sylvestris]
MLKSSLSIDDIGEDLIQNVLCRLPAQSFASAACVSRFWNSICNRILFASPKLSSAISFNPLLEDAVSEVVDKVLSKPMRPHFVLASIGPSFSLQQAHELINGNFGFHIPVVVNVPEGIIGRDSLTDEFREVQWEVTEEEDLAGVSQNENVNRGIILTVGFLPGLKANIIPLLFEKKDPRRLLIDEFVISIKDYTSSVSGHASPSGILLFSDQATDIKPVLQKLDYAFSLDTVIVGDGGSKFLCRSDDGNYATRVPAVALLFVNERDRSPGIGETKFHVMISTGLSPLGSTYKAVSVKCNETSTWLTAIRDTLHEDLDGQSILDEIYDELGDRIQFPVFYLGVTKRRRCSVGPEKVRRITFHEFHEVMGGNEEYLFVKSDGIKSGDIFCFYLSDSKAALSSCNEVSDKLRHLKLDSCNYTDDRAGGSVTKREVFGGIIFSCCGRGDSFFGQQGIDSSTFLENFPGVTFGGTYCNGEIGRGNLSLYGQGNEEGGDARCSWHAFSAVYLIMSYTPPLPQGKIVSSEPGCSSSNR